MEDLSFCNNFWDDKHQGFEVLSHNMKAGVKTSSEFLELLREIYSIEDSCTKSWNKLSKQVNVNSSGSLQPYWLILKELFEKYSIVHMELSQNIQSLIKSVQKYIEEQQIKQKAVKDIDLQTQNYNNLLVNTASQLVRAKDVYHARYHEFHKLQRSDLNNGSKSKEIERMEGKLKKAVDEYKYLIEKYNNTCTKYKSKMMESCQNFQEIEEYHLDQMKEFICRFLNSLFKAQSDFNGQRNEMEKFQENLTVETLLAMFVRSKSTGKIQPSLVTFEDAENSEVKQMSQKIPKENSDTSIDSGLNGNHSGDVVTGNLVNIDSSSDISSTHVSNINLAAPNTKDSMNDIFDQLSNVSDNNSINFTAAVANEVSKMKKLKKYNNIFRRKRNSPSNGLNPKPPQDTDNEKSSQNLREYFVDDEGYSIKPNDLWNEPVPNSSSDSSTDDDQQDNLFKRIKIKIKPQENKSDSSSIADVDVQNKSSLKCNDNSELIKAVQAFKIPPNIVRDIGRRSNTPSLPVATGDTAISHSSSGISSTSVSIRDSRRKKNCRSQSEINSNLIQPYFQVEFTKSFESQGLDLATINDSFNVRFESLTGDPKIEISPTRSDNKLDPWGHLFLDKQSQPPPLPAKIIPQRAASTVPFTHSKTDSSNRLNSIPPNLINNIPATPSRLTINAIEGIPLAIGFTETVNAKFRESFSTSPHDVHTSGQLVISFPCSMLQQFESIGEDQLNLAEPIYFSLTQASRLRNIEPLPTSKDIILKIENPSDDSYNICIDLLLLHKKLTFLRSLKPSLPFFNIDLIRYDVTNSVRPNGSIKAPVHISANWQTSDALTSQLHISYSFHWPNTEVGSLTFRPSTAKSGICEVQQPYGEVRFLVIADGQPDKMQSFPPCIWNSEMARASWRIDLSAKQSTIKSKFILSNGPGTPQPVACQFSAEGAIESGVLLNVYGNRFRISRHKYRLISGRYVWEPFANASGFCV